MVNSTAFTLLGVLLAGTACSASTPATPGSPSGPAGLAEEIREAIQHEDLERFAALISEHGLSCGDSLEPKAQVLALLRARGGMYPGLWSTELLRKRDAPGLPGATELVSYRDFFATSPGARPTIEGDPKRGYLCWRPTCGPSSSLWRFEYACDGRGPCVIVGVGC